MKNLAILIFTLHFSLFTLHLFAQDTIYVPQDYPSIQQGIDAASDDDVVLVADSTYVENISFNGKAITVASYFLRDGDTNHINNTIIDGSEPDDPDYGSTVMFITSEDTTSVLCGFSITGGTGLKIGASNDRIGGGIACYYAGAKIMNNKIVDNEISIQDQGLATGGGIGCADDINERWIIIEHNTISGNVCSSNSNVYGGGVYLASNARLLGNRITTNQLNSNLENARGAGIFGMGMDPIEDTIHLLDNKITNNEIAGGGLALGSGVCLFTVHAKLINNEISWNSINCDVEGWGGGFVLRFIKSLEISHNSIIGNEINVNNNKLWWGAGGYMRDLQGQVLFTNNEIKLNSGSPAGNGRGGGLIIRDADENEVIIDANIFVGNSAFRGGGIYEQGCYNISITNNVFSENTAMYDNLGRGGAIAMNNPAEKSGTLSPGKGELRSLVMNNTFFSNTADYQGGAFHYNGVLSPPIFLNNIFWDNSAPTANDINNVTGETIAVFYSDIDTQYITGPWEGEGNVFEDPIFIDDECHIDQISPCIDSGTDSLFFDGIWYFAPVIDYDGGIRPYGSGGIDIGADENDIFQGINNSTFNTQHSTLNLHTWPNPTNGIYNLRFTIYSLQSVSCSIYDLHGREVMRVLDAELPAGKHVVTVDVSGLPEGMYFCKLALGIRQLAMGKVLLVR